LALEQSIDLTNEPTQLHARRHSRGLMLVTNDRRSCRSGGVFVLRTTRARAEAEGSWRSARTSPGWATRTRRHPARIWRGVQQCEVCRRLEQHAGAPPCVLAHEEQSRPYSAALLSHQAGARVGAL